MLAHLLIHSFDHSLAYLLTCSLTCSLTYSLAHSLAHSLALSLIHLTCLNVFHSRKREGSNWSSWCHSHLAQWKNLNRRDFVIVEGLCWHRRRSLITLVWLSPTMNVQIPAGVQSNMYFRPLHVLANVLKRENDHGYNKWKAMCAIRLARFGMFW